MAQHFARPPPRSKNVGAPQPEEFIRRVRKACYKGVKVALPDRDKPAVNAAELTLGIARARHAHVQFLASCGNAEVPLGLSNKDAPAWAFIEECNEYVPGKKS
jgi:hypothetical protein